jgi:hypothetical protein
MTKETHDAASKKTVLKTKKELVIDNAVIVRFDDNSGHSPPCISYDGDAPSKGERVEFVLENGILYAGVVAKVHTAGGNVMIEFVDGILPVTSK